MKFNVVKRLDLNLNGPFQTWTFGRYLDLAANSTMKEDELSGTIYGTGDLRVVLLELQDKLDKNPFVYANNNDGVLDGVITGVYDLQSMQSLESEVSGCYDLLFIYTIDDASIPTVMTDAQTENLIRSVKINAALHTRFISGSSLDVLISVENENFLDAAVKDLFDSTTASVDNTTKIKFYY